MTSTAFILFLAAAWVVMVFGTGGRFDACKKNPDGKFHWR